MTFDEWVYQLPDDELECLCPADAWRAGALAMIDALIDRGYISLDYAMLAREDVADICSLGGTR